MTLLITKTDPQVIVQDDTDRIMELLQDNKQFIIVNIKELVRVDINDKSKGTKFGVVKTAINKNEILRAF